MFREMRRKGQQLTEAECIEILKKILLAFWQFLVTAAIPMLCRSVMFMMNTCYISTVEKAVINLMQSTTTIKCPFAWSTKT